MRFACFFENGMSSESVDEGVLIIVSISSLRQKYCYTLIKTEWGNLKRAQFYCMQRKPRSDIDDANIKNDDMGFFAPKCNRQEIFHK